MNKLFQLILNMCNLIKLRGIFIWEHVLLSTCTDFSADMKFRRENRMQSSYSKSIHVGNWSPTFL